jgi:hypothetical protein
MMCYMMWDENDGHKTMDNGQNKETTPTFESKLTPSYVVHHHHMQ